MENKNNKKQIAIIIAGLLLVMVLVVSITYAYFTAQARSNEQTVTTGKVKLVYTDPQNNEPYVIAQNIKPLVREDAIPRTEEGLLDQESAKAAIKTFTLTNDGTEKLFVDISLDELTLPTELKRFDFMYALYENGKNVSNGSFEYMEDGTKIMEYLVFEPNESKEYQLCIWIEETNQDQSIMMNKEFSAKITATGSKYWESPEEYFTFDETKGAITGYTGSVTDISIPSKINGVAVTSIGASAFAAKGLTSVIIPNNITSIGNTAFQKNQLTSIVIPNSITGINPGLFIQTPIESIIIPDSVTYIGNAAFNNSKLKSIFIPNSVTDTGMASTFYKNELTNIIIPKLITKIGNSSFGNNKIENVIFHGDITEIGSNTFKDNKISELKIPSSVVTIGSQAFNNNQLPDSQAFIYARNNDGTIDNTIVIGYGGANKEVVVPSNVIQVGSNAFRGCNLTNVTIPNNVVTIYNEAFIENPDLTTITLKGRTEIPSTFDSTWYDSATTSVVFE